MTITYIDAKKELVRKDDAHRLAIKQDFERRLADQNEIVRMLAEDILNDIQASIGEDVEIDNDDDEEDDNEIFRESFVIEKIEAPSICSAYQIISLRALGIALVITARSGGGLSICIADTSEMLPISRVLVFAKLDDMFGRWALVRRLVSLFGDHVINAQAQAQIERSLAMASFTIQSEVRTKRLMAA